MPGSEFFSEKFDEFKTRCKSRFERFRLEARRYKNLLKDKFLNRFKAYSNYLIADFLPNTLAYGALFNVPASFFANFELSLFSVFAFGFLWYILFIEVPDAVQQVIPYVKVKVDA
jgi:hypothetical protein